MYIGIIGYNIKVIWQVLKYSNLVWIRLDNDCISLCYVVIVIM